MKKFAPVIFLSFLSLSCLDQAPTEDTVDGSFAVETDAAPEDTGPDPGFDSDGDGLDDAWEFAAGDHDYLHWLVADSDGDGIDDADEDYDDDGLINRQEQAATRLLSHGGETPHPLRRDLLVELDLMAGCEMPDAALDTAVESFAAIPVANVDGVSGVFIHFYRDQEEIPETTFSGDFDQRHNFMAANGPTFDHPGSSPLPVDRMIHVVVAKRRDDISARGGETVAHPDDDETKTGVFVYYDAISDLHPACGRPVEPVLPDITVEKALAATLVHELGHTLQLGHDTDANGGINYYNIMSLPTSCVEAQRRVHGDGNTDPSLGATADVSAPRFSTDAVELMDFSSVISVDTGLFSEAEGYEM